MKKKYLILSIILLTVVIIISITLFQKKEYTVEAVKIDSLSPDRKLIVYENEKEISFESIKYEDKTILCYGNNPTVAYAEILGEEQLIIVLKNNKEVIAKILKEEK